MWKIFHLIPSEKPLTILSDFYNYDEMDSFETSLKKLIKETDFNSWIKVIIEKSLMEQDTIENVS